MSQARPTRVLILGGGHAGVAAARQIVQGRKPDEQIEVMIVSRETVEIWHGLMPQIISGLVQPQNALVSLREMLPGVTIYPYRIVRIDLDARLVVTSPGDERDEVAIPYDYLMIGLGSIQNVSRFPGLVEHGFQTKTMGDIVYLRNHLLQALERAAVERDPSERRRLLTVVVAGAGFAGVEIASQTHELLVSAARLYPGIARDEIRVVLVGRGERILPALSTGLALRALAHMRNRGIDVRLNTGVVSATATRTELSGGEQIETHTLIVTAGILPNPLVAELPLTLTDGRVVCDEHCRAAGRPGVYAAGDVAAVLNPRTQKLCPPTFLYARAQGICAGKNILREIRGQAPRRYSYQAIGELAFLTRSYAVATLRGVPLHGRLATALGRSFFLLYTATWRRRAAILFDWTLGSVFPRDLAQLHVERSDSIVPMRFAPGDAIVRQGEPGQRFYIISEGEAEVVRETPEGAEERIDMLGPGSYFGELALLRDVRRTATVRALSHTKVLCINRHEFATLIAHLPVLRDAIEARARVTGDRVRLG